MSDIKSFMPATDDWFVVAHIEDERWGIERIVAWALVAGDKNTTDFLHAIISPGYIDPSEDYFYAKGTDKSPIGRRWIEIYEDIVPSARGFREIKDPDLLAKL